VSAVASQFLFDAYHFPPLLLVAIRMPISGFILFLVFRPARPRTKLRSFALFSVIGLWVVQVSYFLAIAYSNAATGTLLQFLSLPMIAVYDIAASKMRVTPFGVMAVIMATVGTAELAAGRPNGSLGLLITPAALAAGLLAAGTAAYYTIASKPLLAETGSATLTSWGMMFGSLLAVPAGIPELASYSVPRTGGGLIELILLIAFVVVFGTTLTFFLYFRGLERITPTEAGISAAMEPITASVVSFLVLRVVLSPFQYLGALLIIGAVAIIVLRSRLPI
jgi:drug/metabolite transporter (DMT)-like permease